MMAVLLTCAGLAAYGGFACLALAMPDNWERAGGTAQVHPARRGALRLAGPAMLAISAIACIWRDGAGFGLLLWALLMSAGALAVASTLTWAPPRLGRLLRVAPSPS